MAKEWWEYLVEPAANLLMGNVVGAVTSPLLNLLGPEQPQARQAQELSPLAAMLAAQEERRRRLLQPGQGIYPVNADVAGALRRIRQRPPGGGSRGIV